MWKVGYFLSCIAVARSFSSLPSCSSDEAELTSKRLQALGLFNSVYTSFHASDVFNLESFLSELGPLVAPEFSLNVPYGGGTYAGLNDAAEYLSLQFSSVNVGGSSFNLSDTGGVLPAVSIDGDAYTTKQNFAANFFPTVTPSLRLPIQSEVVVTFAPCRSRSILPPATIHMLPAWYSITIDLSIDLCSDRCRSHATRAVRRSHFTDFCATPRWRSGSGRFLGAPSTRPTKACSMCARTTRNTAPATTSSTITLRAASRT